MNQSYYIYIYICVLIRKSYKCSMLSGNGIAFSARIEGRGGDSAVASVEKAFQMTSQNASLREREQVSLRKRRRRRRRRRGADVIISRPLNARSSEAPRIGSCCSSDPEAPLISDPTREGTRPPRDPSCLPRFLPSFLPSYLQAISDNRRARYPPRRFT